MIFGTKMRSFFMVRKADICIF